MYDREGRQNKFLAALQGVDVEEKSDPIANDVVKLQGYQAKEAGFGIGLGLGYLEE
jgi:hypothetical protein